MSITVVTGAAGHVGANLVRALLAQGQQVRALIHHDQRALAGLEVELVQGDLADPASLRRAFDGAGTVFHTAARISITAGDWTRLEATNIVGVRYVVDACLHCGVRRLVHFSSVEALVGEPLDMPVDEERPLIDSDRYPLYARSKAAGEREVERGLQRGLDVVILNPTAIIGPHDYRLGLPNTGLMAIFSGRLWALVDGGFNWVDVRDVADGALRAAERAPAGARYILSGHRASLSDLARMAGELCGISVPRLVFPLWMARASAPLLEAWCRLDGRQPLYTPASIQPLAYNPCISHARATRELGYQPRPLEETVADTVRWFQERGLVAPGSAYAVAFPPKDRGEAFRGKA